MTAAAFPATYSDWRIVKGRKCVQIVFEVPIEQSDMAYQVLGGMPDPSKSAWFAIAHMNSGSNRELTNATEEEIPHEGNSRSGRGRSDRGGSRLVQQAAMCCADPVFRAYLGAANSYKEWGKTDLLTEEEAAEFVRAWCKVKSRSEILLGTEAGALWDDLYGQFVAWREAA